MGYDEMVLDLHARNQGDIGAEGVMPISSPRA